MTMYSGQPLSQETSWLVQNELASLEHDFASGSILGVPAHCLIGVEIDFDIRHKHTNNDQRAALESSRASMTAELSLLVPKDEEQAGRKANWLQQIPELTAAELINYQIYRRLSVPTLDSPDTMMYLAADDSPETTLEFVFGNGLYQTGYYDNPGFFEMRTQAAKPTITTERIRRATRVAGEVAQEFGAIFSYEGSHTNFSVWIPDQNGMQPVHTLETEEGQDIARKGVAGMLYALHDSMPVLKPPYSGSPPLKPELLEAHPERKGTIRVVPDRLEQRLSMPQESHDINILALMSGFAHGVNDEAIDTSFITVNSRTLLTAGKGYDKVRDLYLLRALQESLQADGSFVFPGVSELNENRGNGMISSLIGTGVYARGSASPVIESLLGEITLAQEGGLEVDEAAFNRMVGRVSYSLAMLGTPKDTIRERLSRIRVLPDSPIITGSLECEYPCAVKFHEDLTAYSSTPSLGYIKTHVLEAIGRERASAFTHEEAVFRYIGHEILDTSKLPTAEKVKQIQSILDQYPDVDPTIMRERIQHELESNIDRFAKAVQETSQEKNNRRRAYKHREDMHNLKFNLELYDTLMGTVPSRTPEEFLQAQESARPTLLAMASSICMRGIQKFKKLQKNLS